MKNKTRQIRIFVSIVLSILCLAFIFNNSLKDSSESSAQSRAVKEMIMAIVGIVGVDGDIDVAVLRNLAHVAEFALLGVFLGSLFFHLAYKKHTSSYLRFPAFMLLSVLVGVVMAVVDELIQLTSRGRACEIDDVFLDTVGLLIGTVFAIILQFAIIRIKKQLKKLQKEKIAKNT